MESIPDSICGIAALRTFAHAEINLRLVHIWRIEGSVIYLVSRDRSLAQKGNRVQLLTHIEGMRINLVDQLGDGNVLQFLNIIESVRANLLDGRGKHSIIGACLARRESDECLLVLAEEETIYT